MKALNIRFLKLILAFLILVIILLAGLAIYKYKYVEPEKTQIQDAQVVSIQNNLGLSQIYDASELINTLYPDQHIVYILESEESLIK